jgi:hypothetical protein
MALRVRSTSNGNPANIVSARHASATGGEKRLIRLGRPANDNRAAHHFWTTWVALAAIAVGIAVAWFS